MKNNVIPVEVAKKVFAESNLPCIGRAGIREINKLAFDLEAASGVKFIHMELGNPGLPAAQGGLHSPSGSIPVYRLDSALSASALKLLFWVTLTRPRLCC